MSSEIFDALLREKADLFRAAFSTVSTEVFYDPVKKRLRHAGEYGMFREAIVRDFLRFVIPRSLDISTGFVITSMNDVSTQCDVIVFDSKMTPLYQEGDRQRFFPVESISCVGEVKSTLSKKELAIALNKLAATKALSERISHPRVLRRYPEGEFDPINHPDDLVPTILICQKLNFDLSSIHNEVDDLYDSTVLHRHKHNVVLSIEDGLLSYSSPDGMYQSYSMLATDALRHRFTAPGSNAYVHFKLFASCMFLLTTNRTLLYPEFSSYMGTITGGRMTDQA